MNYRDIKDNYCITMVLSGQKQAFEPLVEKYYPAAFAIAYGMTGSPPAAEDIIQNSFVKAYTNLSGLRKRASFGGWFMQIVRQQAVSYLRKRRQHASISDAIDMHAAIDDQCMSEEETFVIVRKKIFNLPEKYRQLIILRFFKGLSTDQIAQCIGKKPGWVRVNLHRAYKKFRVDLSEILEDLK